MLLQGIITVFFGRNNGKYLTSYLVLDQYRDEKGKTGKLRIRGGEE